jgi:hypothetical protein
MGMYAEPWGALPAPRYLVAVVWLEELTDAELERVARMFSSRWAGWDAPTLAAVRPVVWVLWRLVIGEGRRRGLGR